MPKYELMYILSSAVSDNDVPTVVAEVDQYIKQQGGTLLTQEMLGKKKLAYPIKKTRNGFYVVQTFNLDTSKLQEFDNKLRSIDTIIRYLVANVDEQERRAAKDQKNREFMQANRRPQTPTEEVVAPIPQALGTPVESTPTPVAPPTPAKPITEAELDEKIEQALESEDLTK
jgi:small subunit ribosomal protein S6